MREAASRGFWVASRVPSGFSKVMVQDGAKKRPSLEPDPATAPVVERIFGMAEAGRGILDITRTLNDEGIANPTGRLWSKNGVHIILKNEAYTGTLVWGVDAKDKADPVRVEKAFPAIVSKSQFRRVNRKLRSRAPKRSHPRRVGSTYLLSGLVRCKACNRALSGQDAKSGKFAYYVCQSLLKRGSGTCDAPRLNARRFEEKVVGKIRENVLTESNIRALVKMVGEEMDGVAKEQRQKLETIESELVDVKRRLGRLYDLAETTDLDIDDFKPRIREHRERQEKLEASAQEARAILSQRREVLDDVETITAYALDMSMFLKESELTERRAFIESFVKEIVVMPGNAVVRYTIPMPDDSPIPGRDAEEMALNGSVLSTVKYGGPIKWINILKKDGGKDSPPRWWINLCIPDERPVIFHKEVKVRAVRKKSFPLFGKVVDVTWKGEDYGTGLVYTLNNDESSKALATAVGNLEVRSYSKEFQGWTLQVDRRFNPTSRDWEAIKKIADHLLSSPRTL